MKKKKQTIQRDKGVSKMSLNPLSPRDALKHHFTSLKIDLIFLQLEGFLNENSHETGLLIHVNFL